MTYDVGFLYDTDLETTKKVHCYFGLFNFLKYDVTLRLETN